jgi:hypothetical protein
MFHVFCDYVDIVVVHIKDRTLTEGAQENIETYVVDEQSNITVPKI